MGLADVVVVLIVVALFVAAVRYLVRSNKDGCSDCGSREGCAAHANGGTCSVAERMVRDADAAVAAREGTGHRG